MRHSKFFIAAGVLAASVAIAAPASAQARRAGGAVGRAVPRGSVARVVRPQVIRPQIVTVAPYRPRYYYRPGLNLGLYYGYPYSYGYGYAPYAYPTYGYPAYGYPAYGSPRYGYGLAARPYGGVRINVPQKNAEVYADGYFVGTVGDFDGTFQQLSLEPGPHRIEVRAPGFEPISFEVNVEPGRTITYRAAMRPQQP